MATELATPLFSHLSANEFCSVYQPSEDTFLLIDAIENDLPNIRELRPLIVLEVGSGSGVVSAALSSALKGAAYFVTTDINERACTATARTASLNGVNLEPVVTDLVASIWPRLLHSVDVIIFNPPYVLTPNDEIKGCGISAAWAGGSRGRVVMDRFFPFVERLLTQNGIFYLVIVAENDRDSIEALMAEYNFQSEALLSRRTGMEHLSVLKFTRLC